ncbi:flavodoxin domain-containing protein [Puia sp. P3]|uniref:flavodoxin domain-containing protein n=1 Tax=Puia sp. P3 TaxID=3423952 RepID=UPI003D676D5E
MLATPKLTQIQELIAGSSREELVWLSGYLAGVVASQGQSAPIQAVQTAVATAVEAPAAPAINKITIAYGTETGNSKKLAGDFAAKAKKKGINAKLVGLEQYRLGDLAKEEYFFAVISTQGDGEPPAAAKKFYDHIHQGSLKLERLKYGVLALGDTSYPLFCKAGEDVDHQLHKAGGQRLLTLEKCDTDYELQAGKWFETVLQQLSAPAAAPSAAPAPAVAARPTGKKTYTGTVLANINLNDRGSAKKPTISR